MALQPKEAGPVGGWFDRLANWQFVVVVAGLMILVVVVVCLLLLTTGHVNLLGFFIPYGVVWTAGFTGFRAWARGWGRHRSG